MPAVTVSPGETATTSLTIRNDTDIVEAYALQVVGDCAEWSTVEPARVSLYPGTSETVTVRLAPPRSPEVRAGDVPLGVRVLPGEQPDLVTVPETTVTVTPFHELRRELEPRRRRGWLGARYRVRVRNQGNAPVTVPLAGTQDGEELRFALQQGQPRLEPGESAEAGLRVRAVKPIWFGAPVTWTFGVDTAGAQDEKEQTAAAEVRQPPLEGEFVQLSVFPKWLLALLAALLALLLAWFALVRPAVRSTAKQAAHDAAEERAAKGGAEQDGDGGGSGSGTAPGGKKDGAGGKADGQGSGPGGGGGGNGGTVTGPDVVPGSGRQSSATIDVQSGGGDRKAGTYEVPEGKVLGITDIVVANFQGDEGLVTIKFGKRKITTIALETFRNQDYHWVTPIRISEGATVTADVTCTKPGTPATGKRASGCHEVLNVSGTLSDLKR